MSKISEWGKSLSSIDGVDLTPFQDKLLELDAIDGEYEEMTKTVQEKDSQISSLNDEVTSLKEKVWKLFEKQTGISNPANNKPKDKASDKKVADFIKIK